MIIEYNMPEGDERSNALLRGIPKIKIDQGVRADFTRSGTIII